LDELAERWDARHVTRILGLHAFDSQPLGGWS